MKDDKMHTTLSVPTTSWGGAMFEDTISDTKLAVMPTMATMQMSERTRDRTKVALRGAAP